MTNIDQRFRDIVVSVLEPKMRTNSVRHLSTLVSFDCKRSSGPSIKRSWRSRWETRPSIGRGAARAASRRQECYASMRPETWP